MDPASVNAQGMLTSMSVFCGCRPRGNDDDDDEEEEEEDAEEEAAALTTAARATASNCSAEPMLPLLLAAAVRQYGHCCGESQRHSFALGPRVSGASPSYARNCFLHTMRSPDSALTL